MDPAALAILIAQEKTRAAAERARHVERVGAAVRAGAYRVDPFRVAQALVASARLDAALDGAAGGTRP